MASFVAKTGWDRLRVIQKKKFIIAVNPEPQKKKKKSVEPLSQPIRNSNHRCFLPPLEDPTKQNPAGITLYLHHLATVKTPCSTSHQSIGTHTP